MPQPALIELKSVSKDYTIGDETLHALANVSLSIKPGEFIAITGPSGSGKSTLANIIGGLDKPDSGSVEVEGADLAKAGDRQLSVYRNKHIGFVFQAFNLQPTYTALENVMLPLVLAGAGGKERKARAQECLNDVGLADRMSHRPTQLSGGQRQRVSIARALANKPSIIIADEPTGNLDSAKGREIMTLLAGLNKQGITLIIITHDMEVAKQASRVLSIHDGAVKEGRS
ncbi:MAG: ABC-type antimicrobial peptide transport system, ATPase component [Patescibacteria group bacterium]|nr:ABC-type antimicrobial peptide transport system, ATPase component [Patescibacteria group bacterium]